MAHYWVHHCVLEPCAPSPNSTVSPPQLRQHPYMLPHSTEMKRCFQWPPAHVQLLFLLTLWIYFLCKCHVPLCLHTSHFKPQTQSIQAQRNGSATKKESSKSLLPADRNPHWLQTGMVWDNSGTNWQLQLCLSFVSVLFLLFVGLHLKIVNRCMKRGSSCHIVCFPNVTSSCSAVTFHIFQIPNIETRVRATHMQAHIDWEKEPCINKHKQHQKESKRKCESVLDCVMLQTVISLAWHDADGFFLLLLFQRRSDLKIRVLIFGMTTSQRLIWHRGQDLPGSLKCFRRLFVMILSDMYCVILLSKHVF